MRVETIDRLRLAVQAKDARRARVELAALLGRQVDSIDEDLDARLAFDAFTEDMAPVRDAIVSALLEDDMMAFRGLRAMLPDLLKDVLKSQELTDHLAWQMGRAFLEGMRADGLDGLEAGEAEGHPFRGNQWTKRSSSDNGPPPKKITSDSKEELTDESHNGAKVRDVQDIGKPIPKEDRPQGRGEVDAPEKNDQHFEITSEFLKKSLGWEHYECVADHGILAWKHPEYFYSAEEVELFIPYVLSRATKVIPGEAPNQHNVMIIRHDGSPKMVGIRIEADESGKHRVATTFTLNRRQYKKLTKKPDEKGNESEAK